MIRRALLPQYSKFLDISYKMKGFRCEFKPAPSRLLGFEIVMSCMHVMHACHAWGPHMGNPHAHMPHAHVPSLMPITNKSQNHQKSPPHKIQQMGASLLSCHSTLVHLDHRAEERKLRYGQIIRQKQLKPDKKIFSSTR